MISDKEMGGASELDMRAREKGWHGENFSRKRGVGLDGRILRGAGDLRL